MSLPLCIVFIFLVPLALAGLGLVQQGLGRSRSAAHAMLATMAGVSISAIAFVLLGSAWAGYAGGHAHSLFVGGVRWDWLGNESYLGRFMLQGDLCPSLVVALQMFAVGLVAIVPISTGNDRWRLKAICIFTAVLAGILYPLFAHWAWGGGWLSQLPEMVGLPRFVDSGGAGVVQAVGGLAALSVSWVLGPREGKYNDATAVAIPGHNIVLVLFGSLLAMVGWIGLEAAGSILFYTVAPQQVVMVVINAMLSASAGCFAAVITTKLRYRKADASLSANGWLAGLVAGSAACGMVSPAAAVFTGLVAGGLVTFLVEALELKLLVDDPSGSIAVHGGAGLWGLIACGFFVPASGPRIAMILSQLLGVATVLGVMLPLIHLTNLLLNKIVRYRVDSDGDWQGMDIRELGAGAYPEFVMHADEFVPR